MPNYTPNYNLKKPLQTENYNIDDANGNMDIVDSAIKNVEDVVFKYQDPVVVGNLIKLSNKGNSSRLYFKLGADVTGASILISTDDGVTSKPLREIDGTPVTSLEAGFAEVVADATFFTLRNRGISAKDKQALIDVVNSGLLNESSLKDEVIKALNLVNTMGEKIPVGGLWGDVLVGVPKVKTGRIFKDGTVNSGTGTFNFENSNGDKVSRYYVTVGGLGFKPSYIQLIYQTTTTTGTQTTYNSRGFLSNYKSEILISDTYITLNGSKSVGNFKLDEVNAYVNSDGFRLPVGLPSGTYNYIAFE